MAPLTGGLLAFDVSKPELPVVVGALPLPHHENEDVSLSARRKLAVISQQPYHAVPVSTGTWVGGTTYLVDVSNPAAMVLAGMAQLPAEVGTDADGQPLHGPGHTATLVGDDQYLWVSGALDGKVWVVDIHDLAKPVVLGAFATPAGAAGGTAMYELGPDPLAPTLVASITTADNLATNQSIHHNSVRLSADEVLVTEEDYQGRCDSATHQDGSLQTWRLDRGAARLVPVAQYDAPAGADASGAPLKWCSSHWFDVNSHQVVADAWYAAGLRFLDYSDPAHPRPIGMWRGDGSNASQARFVPGRPDLVYVADYSRGLDVVKIDGGGAGAATATPADEHPVDGLPVPGLVFPVVLHAHEDFGWVCAAPSSV